MRSYVARNCARAYQGIDWRQAGGIHWTGERKVPVIPERSHCASVRLAVFDCDGTLVDSQHSIVAAMHAAATSPPDLSAANADS